MTRKKLELLVCIALVIWGCVFFYSSLDYPYYAEPGIAGPGFFPKWVCGVMVVLSLVYLIQTVKSNSQKEHQNVFADKRALLEIGSYLLSVIVFLLLCKLTGFSIAMIAMLLIMFLNGYKWYISLGMSIVTTIILFFIFVNWLQLPLPLSPWGF